MKLTARSEKQKHNAYKRKLDKKKQGHSTKKAEKPQTMVINQENLESDLLNEGRVLGINDNTTKLIAQKVVPKVLKWAEKRVTVTRDDLERKLAKELESYDADLAYVYKNRGKII